MGRFGTCVYCGARGRVTKDHVPPRNLFGDRPPADLMTVKACYGCHDGTNEDDEYFRNTLIMRADMAGNAAVQDLLPAFARSLDNPEAPGLLTSTARSLRHVDVITQGGLYIGKRLAYDVNLRRLTRVAARIVRGLFSKLTDGRLPSDYVVHAYELGGFSPVDRGTADLFRANCSVVLARPPALIKGSVFKCWWAPSDKDKHTSMWIMVFFGKAVFFGLTGQESQLRQQNRT